MTRLSFASTRTSARRKRVRAPQRGAQETFNEWKGASGARRSFDPRSRDAGPGGRCGIPQRRLFQGQWQRRRQKGQRWIVRAEVGGGIGGRVGIAALEAGAAPAAGTPVGLEDR